MSLVIPYSRPHKLSISVYSASVPPKKRHLRSDEAEAEVEVEVEGDSLSPSSMSMSMSMLAGITQDSNTMSDGVLESNKKASEDKSFRRPNCARCQNHGVYVRVKGW